MKVAPPANNESLRLRSLEELDILDTPEEQAYDDITALAAQICGTPIALVSLVAKDRQWFKSHHGLEARETPRDYAFCSHAILQDRVFIVEDSAKDVRFADNPLFTGQPHVAFYAGAPLTVDPGVNLGTLCVIDHHARTLTPKQREALQALARQVVAQLELRMKLKEMARLDRLKDEFVAMVSHELRTPLTSIRGALDLLKHRFTEIGPEHARNLVDVSARNTSRLLNIVNDILDISALRAGKMKLKREHLDMVRLVGQSLELTSPYVEQCDCTVSMEGWEDDSPLVVSGDMERLLQVLGNLISNAAKFTHPGDEIKVCIARESSSVRISITDHGPGIAPEKQHRLFNQFEQVTDTPNNKLPGTGLGLAICKRIVELHDGTIHCDSTPGLHTSFTISLPLATTQLSQPQLLAATPG